MRFGQGEPAPIRIRGFSGLQTLKQKKYENVQNRKKKELDWEAWFKEASKAVTPLLVAHVFIRDVHIGSQGDDVKALQAYLDAHDFAVATSGNGSPGNESIYFGPATQAALIKFQIGHGISPAAGNFGPLTRKIVNL